MNHQSGILNLKPRVDRSEFSRESIRKIVGMVVDDSNFEKVFTLLIDIMESLYNNKVSYKDLIITKTALNYYETSTHSLAKFINRLRNEGKNINLGDKVQFIIIKNESTCLSDKMRSNDEYKNEPIDYDYYIKHELMIIDKILSIEFKDITSKIKFSWQKSSRNKPIFLDQPIKFLLNVKQSGMNLKFFEHEVINAYHKIKDD